MQCPADKYINTVQGYISLNAQYFFATGQVKIRTSENFNIFKYLTLSNDIGRNITSSIPVLHAEPVPHW